MGTSTTAVRSAELPLLMLMLVLVLVLVQVRGGGGRRQGGRAAGQQGGRAAQRCWRPGPQGGPRPVVSSLLCHPRDQPLRPQPRPLLFRMQQPTPACCCARRRLLCPQLPAARPSRLHSGLHGAPAPRAVEMRSRAGHGSTARLLRRALARPQPGGPRRAAAGGCARQRRATTDRPGAWRRLHRRWTACCGTTRTGSGTRRRTG